MLKKIQTLKLNQENANLMKESVAVVIEETDWHRLKMLTHLMHLVQTVVSIL